MPARSPTPGLLVAGACGGCGSPLTHRVLQNGGAWCQDCRVRWGAVGGHWPAVDGGCAGWAAAVYRGPVRRAVLAAKRGAPAAASELLAERASALNLPAGATVTWVPAHPRRAWLQPDAGQALAAAIADVHGLPLERLLRRRAWGRRQGGRDGAARRTNPDRLGLVARRPSPAGPVILVDDVRTTGTTLDHAAALLRAAGATEVIGLVVAQASDAA